MDPTKKAAIQHQCMLIITELLLLDKHMSYCKIMNLVQVELRNMPLFYINDDTLLSSLRCLRYALMGDKDDDNTGKSPLKQLKEVDDDTGSSTSAEPEMHQESDDTH